MWFGPGGGKVPYMVLHALRGSECTYVVGRGGLLPYAVWACRRHLGQGPMAANTGLFRVGMPTLVYLGLVRQHWLI